MLVAAAFAKFTTGSVETAAKSSLTGTMSIAGKGRVVFFVYVCINSVVNAQLDAWKHCFTCFLFFLQDFHEKYLINSYDPT